MAKPRGSSDSTGHTGHPGELIGVGEDVWMEVIDKMDEVYSDLLQYEVALEQKNAKLEESQQFILSVLTSMSDIMVVCDRAGVIEDVNRSLVDFCGRSVEALRGTRIFDLFADEEAASQARRLLMGGEVHDFELPLRARDGSAVPVSLNCTPRFSGVGKSLGVVVTGRPVGELRRAYQALHEAHEDLKRTQQQLLHAEKMASLGRLVAGVAHELNNPISFVLGNVHVLKRYADRLAQYLDAVHANETGDALAALRQSLRIDRLLADLPPLIEGTIEGAERTRDIVDGLKRFSALDRGENTRFDLTDVVERAVTWVCKATRENFRVELDLPPRLIVSGSPGQMQQVMMNLIENAWDASQECAEPRLRIGASIEPGWVELAFHDNGPGISDARLTQIFDPFFTTKPVGKGTGLGLSISYGIVDRHGGRLAAANHPEGGAVLTVRLPLADPVA
jgi:two-component system, NtrC family, sensor histidine kinase HupT/HoxJ